MAVGAGLIFPCVTPVRACANDDKLGMSNGGLGCGRPDQHPTMIAGAQPPQAKVGGSKVVEPCLQVGERTTSKIEFNLVERPGTGGGAEKNLAPGIGAAAGNAGREIK